MSSTMLVSLRTRACRSAFPRWRSQPSTIPRYSMATTDGFLTASQLAPVIMFQRPFHAPPSRWKEPSNSPNADSQRTTRGHDSHHDTESSDGIDRSSGNPQPNYENYSRFFRRLARSLPHPHRPTRDDFLKVATGFWDRARVRFKWFTIKSFRKFNADDISAFVTWFLMSQTLWILVGTTTFFSVVFAIANSLSLQHYIARAISNYLTSETGVTVIFESAIVPKWKDSRISFKNVYVSRRPFPNTEKVQENAGHMAAVGYDVSNHPAYHRIDEEDDTAMAPVDGGDGIRWSTLDLNVDSIDVTLSLRKWLDGKGLVEDAVVKGVRGILDRRAIQWDPEHPLNPAFFRHKAQPGDFQLDSLQLEDVLITVYQPGNFRPYTFSIFRADIGRLRKRWLFYDFLRAENIVGQFDNCLFSLHRPQSIGRTTEVELSDGQWGRISRLRIDGVPVDHLQNLTTQEGPISWIVSGKLDAVFDIKFPRDATSDLDLTAILDAITTTLDLIPGQRELVRPPLVAPDEAESPAGAWNPNDNKDRVEVDIDLRFRDIKAAVPIFAKDLSYTNSAMIRPIVAFMNANRTLIPIHCKIIMNLTDFDGCWTMWETGLMDSVAIKTYDALAYHVTKANMNRRIKTVGVWSLQMTMNAILSALRNVMDPVAANLRELYAYGFPYGVLLDPII